MGWGEPQRRPASAQVDEWMTIARDLVTQVRHDEDCPSVRCRGSQWPPCSCGAADVVRRFHNAERRAKARL